MGDTAQKRALRTCRSRLTEQGMARFDVLGLGADRDLSRALARRPAQGDPDATQIRAAVNGVIAGEPP